MKNIYNKPKTEGYKKLGVCGKCGKNILLHPFVESGAQVSDKVYDTPFHENCFRKLLSETPYEPTPTS